VPTAPAASTDTGATGQRSARLASPAAAASSEAPSELRLVLDDYDVSPGVRLTGSLAGIDTESGEPVTVTISGSVTDSTGATTTQSVDCTVTGGGGSDPASFSCDVPAEALKGSTWTATGSQDTRTSSATFTIDGTANDQQVSSIDIVQGQNMVITGSDWLPGYDVTIVLTGPDGSTVTLTATPADDGTFSVTAPTSMSTTPGVWTAVATNSNGDRASTTYTVSPYEADPSVHACGVLHTKIGSDAPLTYDLSGYYPDQDVTVTATAPDGTTSTASGSTDTDGAFSGMFPAGTAGVWTITGSQSGIDGNADLTASDNCLVIIIGPPTNPGDPGDPTDPGDPSEPPTTDPTEPPTTTPPTTDPTEPPTTTPPTTTEPPTPTCKTDPSLCPVVLPHNPDNPSGDNPTIAAPPVTTIVYNTNTDGPTIAPTPKGNDPKPSQSPSQSPTQTPTPKSEQRQDDQCRVPDGYTRKQVLDTDENKDGYCDVAAAASSTEHTPWWKHLWLAGLALWLALATGVWWFIVGKRRKDEDPEES